MSPEIWTVTDLALLISNPVLARLADKFDDLKKPATTSKPVFPDVKGFEYFQG